MLAIEWLEDGSMKATTVAFDGTIVEKRTGKEIWYAVLSAHY